MPLPRLLTRLVARAKPVVPARAWPTLLTLRSLAGDGAVVGLPAFERVLVVVAHPDDEAIGCAGTIAALTDAGARVEILALTDGDATIGSAMARGETASRRRAELEASARILGAAVRFAHLPDGAVGEHLPAAATAITDAVRSLDPDAVFAPWLGDGHPDHEAAARALAAADLPADVQIWGYETWTALPHNRLVDVSAVIDRKRASVAAHETAALAFDISAGLGLSRWRSMHGLLGEGHAEAFLALDVDQYRTLAAQLGAG